MEHVVFGAGLVGGYLAAALQASDQSVAMVAREATRQKWRQGLRLSDYRQRELRVENLSFIAATDPVPPPTYLWLTVKCTGLSRALTELQPLLGNATTIICLQNGLGAEQQVRAVYPGHNVIRGVMAANIAELAPDHLHRGTQGGIMLPRNPLTEQLQPAFQQPLLPFRLLDDLNGLLWAKLQLNLNNPINALAGVPLTEELSQRGYRRVLAAAMQELLQVARARAIVLPRLGRQPPEWTPRLLRLPDVLFRRLAKTMLDIDPRARSSMWQDLQAGRLTEIDFLNGAVARLGEEVGVACPVNQRLTALIHAAERGEQAGSLSAAELQRQLGL